MRHHGGEIQKLYKLYSVEFALNVVNKGLVVLCAVPDPRQMNVRAGDPIEFVRPDGTGFRTTVKALDLMKGSNPGLLGLVLPNEVVQDDIPRGTVLRLVKAT
jgi:hypothetical protein